MRKKAFTLIELVFVIVILGIVSSIGAEIISKLYDNYLKTRSINRLQFQTELILNKIAKRLTHRVKDSVIAQKSDGTGLVTLQNIDTNVDYTVLSWVGKSYESFLGNWNGIQVVPGWSGFVDLYSSETNTSQIKTSGSHLPYAANIIEALSYGDINISVDSPQNAVLIFKEKDDYNVTKYGWNGNDANYTYNIQSSGNDILLFKDKNASTIYEQYDLAWTAYAIVADIQDVNDSDFNLTLKYNFQPWDGDEYNTSAGSSVIAEHVSSFKFRQDGETIRIKLCIRDDLTGGDYGFCKEKVVF